MSGTKGRVGALPMKAEALVPGHVESLKQAEWASPVLVISVLTFSRSRMGCHDVLEPKESRSTGTGGHRLRLERLKNR